MPPKRLPIDRQALYREVWAEPVTVVAKRYGISDVALRKRCRWRNVPTPPKRYWSKPEDERARLRPPLPPEREKIPRPPKPPPLPEPPITPHPLCVRVVRHIRPADQPRAACLLTRLIDRLGGEGFTVGVPEREGRGPSHPHRPTATTAGRAIEFRIGNGLRLKIDEWLAPPRCQLVA